MINIPMERRNFLFRWRGEISYSDGEAKFPYPDGDAKLSPSGTLRERVSTVPLYFYMRNLIFYVLCLGFIISLTVGLTDNLSYVQQNSSVNQSSINSNNSDDAKTFTSFKSQQLSNSSNFQRTSLNLQAVNLNQPHVLKINSTGTQLQGQISINGKVVKQLNSNQSEINLSPYLSTGQQKVQLSANYTPPSAAVNVEVNGSGNNISQQASGSGTLNYSLDLTIQ